MSANAIERLARYVPRDDHEHHCGYFFRDDGACDCGLAERREDVAAVEALLEAADTWAYERRRWIDGEATDRAAMQDAEVALVHAVLAVRRVETGQ